MRPSLLLPSLLPLLGASLVTAAHPNKLFIPHPARESHEDHFGSISSHSSLASSVTGNATLKAQLETYAGDDNRTEWVSNVRKLGKEGKISAQWYPGYNAYILPVDQIDFSTVNLLFWFVQVTEQGGLNATVDGPLDQLVLAAAMHGVPVVATVGGWDGGLWFGSIMSTAAGRASFAQQAADFVDAHHLSGFEIDWEYPGNQGIGCNNVSAADLGHLGKFFVTLREELGEDRLITIDVGSGGLIGADGGVNKDLNAWSKPIDYFNIMNYDTYGSWSATTGPNAALSDLCNGGWSKVGAIPSVALFANAGVPEEKLLLGMPGYGYSYVTLSKQLNATVHYNVALANKTRANITTELYQKKTKVQPHGDYTDSDGHTLDPCGNVETPSGLYMYRSLIDYGFLSEDGTEGENGFTRYWDECSSTPFLYAESNQTLISYDDASSLAIKTSWAQDHGIAGVTIFDSTGPTPDVFQAVMLATSDRPSLWAKGIMTVENATVVVDRPSTGNL